MEDGQCLLEHILDGAEDPMDLPLALLQKITDGFSKEREIGQGGFGAVYKGVFRERIVAVKKIYVNLEKIDDDDKQFGREINCLWNTNHPNVVRFLGFCSNIHQKQIIKDGAMNLANVRERLFCFEYVSNGSLDKHITDELRGLNWETRYEIITGICEGLCYLHEEKEIIHMDLKPANILLDYQDGKYIPKIADFGLSRPNKNSHTVGRCYGTLGYWAPENREGSKTTPACDIYSLGAIIMELVTGGMEVTDKHSVLRRWRHRWNNLPTPLQYKQVTGCIDIAVRCRKQKPEARPSIKEIIDLLNESTNGHTGQISPCLDEDDMLRINPLELWLPYELKNEISCSVELINDTCKCIAFNIQLPSARYNAQPDKGIVRPESKYSVNITVQAGDIEGRDHADKFVVQGMQVEASEGFRDEDITGGMFEKMSKFVDKVDLMVVHESVKPHQENCKRREDTNMPDEEVPKAKKRKMVEFTSGKGKNKLDRSENAETTSMIKISSSAGGQCTKQLDRHNFHPPRNFSHSQATNMTYLLDLSDRAMDVTRGAMGSLLHKLGVLDEEFNLKTSVQKDAYELVKMQHLLRKVSDVQQANLDALVKRWASNVREMSYDLEDFVDGFLGHSEPDPNKSGFRELTHEMCFHLDQPISELIKHNISEQVQDGAQQHKEYNVDNFVANATTKAGIEELRILAIYEDQGQLVGIETPRDELIRLFEEDGVVSKQNLKIVSIVGLGGLGKTTLAKTVHKNLKAQYDHNTFVSVGQNPDMKKVLKNIIRKFMKKGFSGANLNVGDLIEELQEFLEDKRYLIVIDDVWDSKVWGLIRSAFPRNNHGSRVITTTRIESVARACCKDESKNIYRMKPLSEEDSRKLFLRRIFGPGKDCPAAQKGISTDILKKCGGMPLAINSIASLLAGQPRSTWEYVRKTLGAIIEENPEIGNMKQILDLSYMHLPDHLKTCLLYICKYGEDEEIDKNDLLRQWVAEGFVVSKNGRLDVEDVAENYFKGLINMCMIEPRKIDCNDEVLSYRVHDIVLELIRTKAAEENFIHVIDGLKDERGAHGKIRRVAVHHIDEDGSRIVTPMKGCSHVRSVLLYQASPIPYFMGFKYVRVLHLQDIGGICSDLDVTGISKLFLLRYSKIEGSYTSLTLPDQIGELQQLETIDLITGSISWLENGLENYPLDIVCLPRLLHLSYDKAGIALPDEIGRLRSLRTLEGVCAYRSSVESIRGLGELTNLRKLQICVDDIHPLDKERTVALYSSLSMLSASIRTLNFRDDGSILQSLRQGEVQEGEVQIWSRTLFPRGSDIRELDLSCGNFQSFPKWIGQLHNLCSLSIWMREVDDGVSIVEWLPSLAYFHLDAPYCEKKQSVVISGRGTFQALKHLSFSCPNASLIFEAGAMPNLEKLDILFPYRMTRRFLPVGIQHLPARTVKEINLNVAINSTTMENGLDALHWAFVKHVRRGTTSLLSELKRKFEKHQCGADIVIRFEDDEDEDGNEEDYQGANDEEDYYFEDDDDDVGDEEDGQANDDENDDKAVYHVD